MVTFFLFFYWLSLTCLTEFSTEALGTDTVVGGSIVDTGAVVLTVGLADVNIWVQEERIVTFFTKTQRFISLDQIWCSATEEWGSISIDRANQYADYRLSQQHSDRVNMFKTHSLHYISLLTSGPRKIYSLLTIILFIFQKCKYKNYLNPRPHQTVSI